MKNTKELHMKWHIITTKNGMDLVIQQEKKQTKYHFVQELWQLQMYLMHYLPADVIKCFEIIKNDAGQEFDPFLVEIFLQNRRQIEKICEENNSKKEYFL